MIGREACTILLHHRLRIQAAISQYVEPQIEAMLEELARSLDAPFDGHDLEGPRYREMRLMLRYRDAKLALPAVFKDALTADNLYKFKMALDEGVKIPRPADQAQK